MNCRDVIADTANRNGLGSLACLQSSVRGRSEGDGIVSRGARVNYEAGAIHKKWFSQTSAMCTCTANTTSPRSRPIGECRARSRILIDHEVDQQYQPNLFEDQAGGGPGQSSHKNCRRGRWVNGCHRRPDRPRSSTRFLTWYSPVPFEPSSDKTSRHRIRPDC